MATTAPETEVVVLGVTLPTWARGNEPIALGYPRINYAAHMAMVPAFELAGWRLEPGHADGQEFVWAYPPGWTDADQAEWERQRQRRQNRIGSRFD